MPTLLKNLSSTTTRRSVSLWSTFMKAAAWRALQDGRCRAGYPRWSSRHFQVMHRLFRTRSLVSAQVSGVPKQTRHLSPRW